MFARALLLQTPTLVIDRSEVDGTVQRWGIEVRIAVTHRTGETLDAVNPQIPDVQRRKIIIIFNLYPKNRSGQLFSNRQ